MARSYFDRLSPGLVVSVIALFVALGGVSAVALQGKNSVDSGDIKKNAVKGKHIKKNSVVSSDIKDGVVSAADIADGGVGTAEAADNSLTGTDVDESTLVDPNEFRFSTSLGVAAPDQAAATVGPLTFSVRCLAGPDVELIVTTTEANGYANGDDGTADDDFDPGDTVILAEGIDEDDQFIVATAGGVRVVGSFGGTETTILGSACTGWGEITRTD